MRDRLQHLARLIDRAEYLEIEESHKPNIGRRFELEALRWAVTSLAADDSEIRAALVIAKEINRVRNLRRRIM